ncbi:MAG TPA: histidine kinase dimerization/phospho-acceptor domain-containing protein, partial [Longimicrobiales bacterium]|nr:histidine kinase dimerization/phospho-acceptor domain-containing protein [Longimicrobiales bacterium]
MINRLVEQLDNPRRHLTFLVGVLALVFVLTAVVAWRGSAAERDRAELARRTLDETAQMALKDWSLLYNTYVGSLMPHFAAHVMQPQFSLDGLREAAEALNICEACSAGKRISSAFSVDPATGAVEWSGDPVDPRVGPAVLARIAAKDVTRFHPSVRGGFYFIETDTSIVSALVFMRSNGDVSAPVITGVVLDRATSREMLAYAAQTARLLQTALAPGATADELFARSADVGGTQLFGTGSSNAFQRVTIGEPVYGLTLAVGPQPAAVDLLQFGADPMAERLTMIMLMLVIGALLAMALLQVRREAELTRLRADFVSGVSHELRTPLAQIRMFTETLLLGRVRSDVERRRSLEIID